MHSQYSEFKMAAMRHFDCNGFIPKVNQIIRNTYRTSSANLNTIRSTASYQRAFWPFMTVPKKNMGYIIIEKINKMHHKLGINLRRRRQKYISIQILSGVLNTNIYTSQHIMSTILSCKVAYTEQKTTTSTDLIN